jgi:hypothetical protein
MRNYFHTHSKGFNKWNGGNREEPLIDLELGTMFFFYQGRVRVRYSETSWVTLGANCNYGRFWDTEMVVLKSTNRDWLSAWSLEYRIMRPLVELAHVMNAAHDIGDGTIHPEVVDYLTVPAAAKTKEITALSRVAQQKWSRAVIALAGGRCDLTGTTYALDAAHIKPFKDCNDREAYDLANGVCLTASAHRLFDAGLLTSVAHDPLMQIIDADAAQTLIARRDAVMATDQHQVT